MPQAPQSTPPAAPDSRGQRILILDFGSQYTHLIARRIRALGVYCEIHPWSLDEQAIRDWQPAGVVLSGGPENAPDQNAPRLQAPLWDMGIPVLGICYGMQVLAAQLGGRVASSSHSEFGHALLQLRGDAPLLSGLSDSHDEQGRPQLNVWMSHGDRVIELPAGFQVLGQTANAEIAAMGDTARACYGVQFHPEVSHTPQGDRILQHFVRDICGCAALWQPRDILRDTVAEMRRRVGEEQVLVALSGGVDSAVTALLLRRALGERMHCLFVDNGLLRQDEGAQLTEAFNTLNVPVRHCDESQLFLQRLHGISDPEEKRRIIGNTFIEVFEREARRFPGVSWLAQGTIYPDVIESAGGKSGSTARRIKSHHNVGGLPERLNLKLLEPLRDLFKDEVRKLGAELQLPDAFLHRHPFPGPGLAVRVLGEVHPEYLEVLRPADAIFLEELQRADLYHQLSQAFAVFLPVRSVGVVGDARRYAWVISLRAVETNDFMTARWAQLPGDFLATVSRRIVNEIPQVSRVVYDISDKPPATVEWE